VGRDRRVPSRENVRVCVVRYYDCGGSVADSRLQYSDCQINPERTMDSPLAGHLLSVDRPCTRGHIVYRRKQSCQLVAAARRTLLRSSDLDPTPIRYSNSMTVASRGVGASFLGVVRIARLTQLNSTILFC